MNAHKEEDNFYFWYLILILSLYLTPASNSLVSQSLLSIDMNKDNIKDLDWCDFVGGWMLAGIKHYQEFGDDNVQVEGCLHVLSVRISIFKLFNFNNLYSL